MDVRLVNDIDLYSKSKENQFFDLELSSQMQLY